LKTFIKTEIFSNSSELFTSLGGKVFSILQITPSAGEIMPSSDEGVSLSGSQKNHKTKIVKRKPIIPRGKKKKPKKEESKINIKKNL